MRFYRKQSDGASFWPALADLILAVLLLTMVIWTADSAIRRALDIFYPRPKPSETLIDKTKLEDLLEENKRLEEEIAKRPKKPLVFKLDEASGYAFKSGEAFVPEAFKERLKTNVVQKVEELIKDYPVEVMEVVGHTDGTSRAASSNFDELLPGFVMDVNAQSTIDKLQFGSNTELGLARALAVASVLTREFSKSSNARVRAIVARVSSAAQLSDPSSGNILGAPQKVDMPERRRIDLRFTKRDDNS